MAQYRAPRALAPHRSLASPPFFLPGDDFRARPDCRLTSIRSQRVDRRDTTCGHTASCAVSGRACPTATTRDTSSGDGSVFCVVFSTNQTERSLPRYRRPSPCILAAFGLCSSRGDDDAPSGRTPRTTDRAPIIHPSATWRSQSMSRLWRANVLPRRPQFAATDGDVRTRVELRSQWMWVPPVCSPSRCSQKVLKRDSSSPPTA